MEEIIEREAEESVSEVSEEVRVEEERHALVARPAVKLSNFNGKGNVKKWFDRFEMIADLSRWNGEDKLLMTKLHLVGDATLFNEEEFEYEELRDTLLEFFDKEPSKELIIQKLFKRKQNHREPVVKFAKDIKILARKAESDHIAKEIFIQGLNYNIREFVMLRNPETIEDAIIAAKQKEELLRNSRPRFRSSNSPISEKIDNRICYKCKQKGHIASKCTNSKVHLINEINDAIVSVTIGNTIIQAVFDTGSFYSLLDKSSAETLSLEIEDSDDLNLTCANNSRIHTSGKTQISFLFNNATYSDIVYIVDNLSVKLLLGRKFMKENDISLNINIQSKVLINNTGLESLLTKYNSLFNEEYSVAETTFRHSIVTTGNPIFSKPYRVSASENKQIEEEVENLLNHGLITKSCSPWASPVILIKKKDGTNRFCVDYRKLNSVTVKDRYPLPRIDEIFDSLGGNSIFTTLDLRSGYWQIPIDSETKQKTCFICKSGTYEFNVLPFGLCNAPSTFQRVMDDVLRPLIGKCVFVYMDDIIVYSKSVTQHLDHLDQVFSLLKNKKFKLKKSKCQFSQSELKFLGHRISAGGIAVDYEKSEAIQKIQFPTNKKQLQQYLGLCNYYGRFILNFSVIAEPLYNLLRNGIKFDLNEECQSAFQKLQEKLLSAPVLGFPVEGEAFYLYTDASNVGIGAILMQMQNGKETTICYLSRTLQPAERNYCATEKECLAVVWAIKTLRHYLTGVKFTVFSDHASLQWLSQQKDPTGRMTRWSLLLQSFDFIIKHKKGTQIAHVDALSRCLVLEKNTETDEMVEFQKEDPDAALIRKILISPTEIDDRKLIPINIDSFILENNLVYHIWWPNSKKFSETKKRLFLPKVLVPQILRNLHDDSGAHLGFEKTYAKVRDRFFWNNMYSQVKEWIKTCPICNKIAPSNSRKVGLLENIVASEPFETVGVDILGPLKKSNNGNKYIIVFTDYFSKWVECAAIPDYSALTTAEQLVNLIICRHGAPRKLISDKGKNFLSEIVTETCTLMKIKKLNTTAYHPQTDGLTERFNRTLIKMLTSFTNSHGEDWDVWLQLVLFAYRTSVQTSTQFTPFQMLYGREPKLPLDRILEREQQIPKSESQFVKEITNNLTEIHQIANQNLMDARSKQKTNYDTDRKTDKFQIGDLVLLHCPPKKKGSKFNLKWKGPYKVIDVKSPLVYKIKNQENRKDVQTVNIQRLKKYFERKNEDKEFVVETILDKKIENGKIWFLIKWKGFSNAYNKWIPKNETNCPEKIKAFEKLSKSRGGGV